MEIRCKGSNKFFFEINVEEFYDPLKKMGVDVSLPIKVKIPCPKCKMIEEYEIYSNHYVHTKSYERKK